MLFVDGDASAAMYKLKLELDGYRVEVAGDGESAPEMGRTSLPDIIFLDMPCASWTGSESWKCFAPTR
ncbi:MAG: hypothetical protein ACREOY_03565 [Candidatus Dormibacteraceae bacterium]